MSAEEEDVCACPSGEEERIADSQSSTASPESSDAGAKASVTYSWQKPRVKPTVNDLLTFAEDLLKQCQVLDSRGIKGVGRVEKSIRVELQNLQQNLERQFDPESLEGKPLTADSPVATSNLPFFGAVLHAAVSVPQPFALFQSARLQECRVRVDLMCRNGAVWVKVIAHNPLSLHTHWLNAGRYGERGSVSALDDLIKACGNPDHPERRLHVIFYKGVTMPLSDNLEQMGVSVLGERIEVPAGFCSSGDSSDNPDDSHLSESEADCVDPALQEESRSSDTETTDIREQATTSTGHSSRAQTSRSGVSDRQTSGGKKKEQCDRQKGEGSKGQKSGVKEGWKSEAQEGWQTDLKECRKAEMKEARKAEMKEARKAEAKEGRKKEGDDSRVQEKAPSEEAGPCQVAVKDTPKQDQGDGAALAKRSKELAESEEDKGKVNVELATKLTPSKSAAEEQQAASGSTASAECAAPSTPADTPQNVAMEGTSKSCYSGIAEAFDVCSPHYWKMLQLLFGSIPDLSKIGSELDGGEVLVNLDVTALIAMVSRLCNGGANWVFTERHISKQAADERIAPTMPIIEGLIRGKQLVACKSALKDFRRILGTLGGSSEKARAAELLARVQEVEDNPSPRVAALMEGTTLKKRPKIVFGTGDELGAITLSANQHFVRAAAAQDVNLLVHIIPARALSEIRESTATPIPHE